MTPQFDSQVSIYSDNNGPCLYHFQTAQGHCGAYKKKWNQADTDLCPCGEKQMMSHFVDSCPLSKLNGGLLQLHSAGDEALADQLRLLTHAQER